MPLTQPALQAVLKSQTEMVFLECLAFVTEAETLKLVNDTQDLETSDGTYRRFPFVVTVSTSDNRPPEIKIKADAVDQRIISALRSVAGSRFETLITYKVVTAQTPDSIEYGPSTFAFQSMATNGYAGVEITATFIRAALTDAYPSRQISPSDAGE